MDVISPIDYEVERVAEAVMLILSTSTSSAHNTGRNSCKSEGEEKSRNNPAAMVEIGLIHY